MDELHIGIGVSSVGRFLPNIGKEAGLFDRQRLSVQIINQQDEEKVVTDILSGATPIGTPNAPSLLFALIEGADLVIIGGILNRPGFYVAGGQGIATVADLEGKRIGINQPRRMAGVVMLALLRQWGFDPEADLTLIELGVNDKSLEALQRGEIDAALLPPEKAFLAEQEGCNLVADSLGLESHWVPLATTRRFLQAHPETTGKIAGIYRESIQIFQSEPELALRVIRQLLPNLAKRPQVVEKVYRFFADEFEPTLEASRHSLGVILEEIARQDPRARDIKIDCLIDDRFATPSPR